MSTVITKGDKVLPFDRQRLFDFIDYVSADYPHLNTENVKEKLARSIEAHEEYSYDQINNNIQMTLLENVDMGSPDWTFVAARAYLQDLYKRSNKNRGRVGEKVYGDFYGLIRRLTNEGIYTKSLLKRYSKEEVDELGKSIDSTKDNLLTYIGVKTLADRYLATDHSRNAFELPQERWMVIAMHLMSKEKVDRLRKVKEVYWALSNLYMTVATPTLANAGKSYGQMSSCFIDMPEDSLEGIYGNNNDVATLSKGGGGLGVYMGKVRALASAIKNFKGASGGTIPWIKQLNNTAVSVDQLGQRQGAIAVYLDIWHKDIPSFLELKNNNGDERDRARDIFTGLCIPDIFMEAVEARGDWYLFDPHEVRQLMGYSIEDSYDEEKGSGTFRTRYAECVNNPLLSRTTVKAIDIMKKVLKAQLEHGFPFMFYRDTVNRLNPNKHEGMIYSSNLCTEIMQNMSPTKYGKPVINGNSFHTPVESGDFVVCNLSSINLGRAVPANVLERLISIQVRMLDNVIDLNTIEVPQATITNNKFRSIGLGTFGWHHLLALENIKWESEESITYTDKLYEKIAYLTIKASSELAEEKGAYSVFEGSDWETGDYFRLRDYVDEEGKTKGSDLPWGDLAVTVKEKGIRNAYLMAVAPNATTSIIAGSTASIDPIFNIEYSEEKKDYRIPVTAPDINPDTYEIYKKSAYLLDQHWSIKQNVARQRHIDQAQSFNFYVKRDIKASALLNLHLSAWNEGCKTTYYTRSTAVNIEECEWCAS